MKYHTFIKHSIGCTLLFFYPYQNMVALNYSPETTSINIPDESNTSNISPAETAPVNSTNPVNILQTFGLTNHYDVGPLAIGGEYDTLFGTIFNARYAQQLTRGWAIGLLGEYGINQHIV